MVKHIVLFNVKEGEDKEQVAKIAASVLEPLAGKIEGLNHVEVKRTYAGADIALYGHTHRQYYEYLDGNIGDVNLNGIANLNIDYR